MRDRLFKARRQSEIDDVGTLWTMHRREHAARCALMTGRGSWRVCVLVDGQPLLEECCELANQAFAIADQWRRRMLAHGWQQRIPAVPRGPATPAGGSV